MLRKFFSILAFSSLFLTTGFQASYAQDLDLSQNLPIDSKVTKGTLPNGLTYYIRPNAKPENKVELRLVVKAGSLMENDNQQGLAHFMEHMNFNGLKRFPKNELVHYLQSIGVEFGADLNAFTSFDETQYILPIPTDNPENIVKGFEIVSDWAHGALITTEEVDAERNVVYEELRMRDKDAGARMREQFFPFMLNHSRYAQRLPIGKDSIILKGHPDRIREFYHDWYRPNLMAVIVVGDITAERAESMIKKYFGDIKNPKNERQREIYTVDSYTSPKAQVITDHEATGYTFYLMFPSQKRQIEKTLGDYRENLIKALFTQTLNKRLSDLTQNAQPPYTMAYADLDGMLGGLTLTNQAFTMYLTPVGSFENGIDSAVAEILRVKQYGFFDQDIENAKKSILASYEKAYNEKEKTISSRYINEYAENFMRQEPIPGIENEYEYVQKLLPTITTQEISKMAEGILSNFKNFYTLITAPEKGDIQLPSESGLLTLVQNAFAQKVSQRAEKKAVTSLLKEEPTPGTIVSQTQDKELKTTTFTLSNGLKVTLKTTDFKDDEIVFRGVKFGGTGQFGAADKANVQFMDNVIETMGYGDFTPTELRDFLSGKTLSLTPDMGASSNVISGSSSVKDFASLLELNYLQLTEPRLDEDLFQGFITKMSTQLKFLMANPQAAFADTLVKTMFNNDPLAPIAVPTEKDLQQINPKRVVEIYKEQYSNADGFHFFIIGNIDAATLKPLMEKYIASLPVKGTKPMYRDNGLRPVAGTQLFKFYKGSDPKSLIISQFHGDNIEYSDQLELRADLLGQLMTMEIIDTIREKMAAIYGGQAYASVVKVPYPHYTVAMQMPCGPENVENILTELDREVKGYKTNGGPASYLDKVKTTELEKHKENMKKNSFWARNLEQIMVWGNSKEFFLNYAEEVKKVSTQDIIKTANLLLGNNWFTGVSFPETN